MLNLLEMVVGGEPFCFTWMLFCSEIPKENKSASSFLEKQCCLLYPPEVSMASVLQSLKNEE